MPSRCASSRASHSGSTDGETGDNTLDVDMKKPPNAAAVHPRCRVAHLPTCRRWSPGAVPGPFGSLVCAQIERSGVGRRLLTGMLRPLPPCPPVHAKGVGLL